MCEGALSPYYKEGVAAEVIALHDIFIVLKNNFNVCSVVSAYDTRVKVYPSISRSIRHTSNSKNSINFEVVCNFQRSVGWFKRHTVDCIPLLAINLTSKAGKADSPGRVNHTIVVRALWIGPWSTRRKISPETCKET